MTAPEIKELLRARLSEQLVQALAPGDDAKSFLQLGVDSVVATDLIEFIRRKIAPNAAISALFDYPSIRELSRALAKIAAPTAERIETAAERPGPKETSGEKIAIVGMAGRFPGARNAQELWRNLLGGVCSISDIPAERARYWDLAGLKSAHPSACTQGGFLGGIEEFDPLFFGISPKEAAVMDPQQRLFLENAWNAVEDAGYSSEQMSGSRCGVYVGVMNTDYQDLLTQANALKPEPYELMGSAGSILAARIAFHLNLKGPALSLDTACSSSLVALHLACQALLAREIDSALAGGVTLYLTAKRYNLMSGVGMLTQGAGCRPFDAAADGFVPGEGVGVLFLKRYSDAIADGDAIRGVIVGSAVHQAGRSSGITVPNSTSQEALLKATYDAAKISTSTVQYIEAHGTGTKLGDPIEAEALMRVFGSEPRSEPCFLGSVKANLGHTSGAAGVAGIIKMLLAMEHERIPPQVNFVRANPHIPRDQRTFTINTTAQSWERSSSRVRRAGVSAFGFSGTNAHVILEEPPAASVKPQAHPGRFWFTLSARTKDALRRRAEELLEWLIGRPETDLAGLSFTLNTGRTAFEERLAFMAGNIPEVQDLLRRFATGIDAALFRGSAHPTAEIADGTGSFEELGKEWAGGKRVGWGSYYPKGQQRRLHCPGYPFEREAYWYDMAKGGDRTDKTNGTNRAEKNGAAAAPRLKLRTLATEPAGTETAPRVVQKTEAPPKPAQTVSKDVAETSAKVRSVLATTLCMNESQLDTRRKFFDLGLDSILVVELVKRLNKEFRVNISAATVYDQVTPDQLAGHIHGLVSGSGAGTGEHEGRFFGREAPPPVVEPEEPVREQRSGPLPAAAKGIFRHLSIQSAGDVEELKLESSSAREPAPGEVSVRVQAASVMFADLLCVRGLYPTMPPYPFTPGFEFAGIVESTGSGSSRFKPGMRVYGIAGASLGGHSEIVNVDERFVIEMPEPLSFEEAAGLPIAFLTAYCSLVEVGKLKAGERVLIHSAASATGLLAIQLARNIGAEILATVGSETKVRFLQSLGIAEVWNYREAGDRGRLPFERIDVVLNMLTGAPRDQALAALAPAGRFVDIATAGLKRGSPIDLSALSDNQGYFGVDCRKIALRSPERITGWLQRLNQALQAKEVRPLPVQAKFPLNEAAAAYQRLQARSGIGRIILVPQKNEAAAAADPAANPAKARGNPSSAFEPIAVIGMAGRFPDARNLAEFWENLARNKVSIHPIEPESLEKRFGSQRGCPARAAALIEGIDEFDAEFFGIAPAEAGHMSAEQRLLLQSAWTALEDAGCRPDAEQSRGGVFVGIGSSAYFERLSSIQPYSLAGNLNSAAAGRIAYLLNWRGPCLSLDTGCSSSYAAIHLACRSLASRESDIALACGVHLLTNRAVIEGIERMGLLSATGGCDTLSSQANGWIVSEGVGATVLKRLEDALKDGDPIRAIIRGSGMNHDGAKNGFTSAKAAAQAELQKRVYAEAGIKPDSIQYLELHGLSTPIGDEIELAALRETFSTVNGAAKTCALGTLKRNIGHPVIAAGMACFFKAVLALGKKQLPPFAGVDELNPNLHLDQSPFYLNSELSEWKAANGAPRRAALNGLSATGTNCHLILEEAPGACCESTRTAASPVLVVLSARSAEALRQSAQQVAEFLRQQPGVDLTSLAFTLQTGRAPLEHRLAFAASSREEIMRKLLDFPAALGVLSGVVKEFGGALALLISGEEGKEFINAALRNGSLQKLAELWVAGAGLDWNLLYGAKRPARMALPTYPFARTRFWLDEEATLPAPSNNPDSPSEQLRAILSRALGKPTLHPEADLFKQGLSSLLAIRVSEEFKRSTAIDLPVRLFFEQRTLAKLRSALPLALERPAPRSGEEPRGMNIPNSFGLTQGQRALWSIHYLNPRDSAYHVPVTLRFASSSEKAALVERLKRLTREQPALRTMFARAGTEPRQRILPHFEVILREHGPASGSEAELPRMLQSAIRKPFELEEAPPWRAEVFSTESGAGILLLTFHHLIFDGQSLATLLGALFNQVIPEGIPFSEFAAEEEAYLAGESKQDEEFWLSRFPRGFSSGRPAREGGNPGVFSAQIPKELVTGAQELAGKIGISSMAVFLGAFQLTISRALGTHQPTIGLAVDVRPSSRYESTMGYFVNLLPIRARVPEASGLGEAAKAAFQEWVEAFEHRRFPFCRLAQNLAERGLPAGELPFGFYFQTWKPGHAELFEKLLPGVHQTGEMQLILEIIEGHSDWKLNVKHQACYSREEAESLANKFLAILRNTAVSKNAGAPYPPTHRLIEEQCKARPDSPAVLFQGKQLAYAQLDARANQIANYLRDAAGVTPGSLVGVLLDRSVDMVAALLAVWKSGAAYVPLDPTYPEERLDLILREARVAAVVTQSRTHPALQAFRRVELDKVDFTSHSASLPPVETEDSDLAYVIFTSGSTGAPKGVQITHRSLSHFLLEVAKRPGCGPGDRVLALTTICFDIAALELFLPLSTGGSVEVLPADTVKNGIRLRGSVETSGATIIQGTPATWKMLLAAGLGRLPRTKILCGGEAWDQQLAGELLDRAAEVWNMYGPTETTIWSSAQKVERGTPIHLGDPIGNTQFYVLNEEMAPVPKGEIGELYIGGDGLARGYFNLPELTRDRFIPNPFNEGQFIYRTGDLVRYV